MCPPSQYSPCPICVLSPRMCLLWPCVFLVFMSVPSLYVCTQSPYVYLVPEYVFRPHLCLQSLCVYPVIVYVLFPRVSPVTMCFPTDIAEAGTEEDIDDFILAELNYLLVSPIFLDKQIPISADNYSDYSWKIATYLTTLRQPPEMNAKEFNSFKKKPSNLRFKTISFFVEIVKTS